MPSVRLRGARQPFQFDCVAEVFQLVDQAVGRLRFVALLKKVPAEIPLLHFVLHTVISRHQDRAANRDGGPFLAPRASRAKRADR